MKHIIVGVPISCTEDRLKQCCLKLFTSLNISTHTHGDLLTKKLTVYLPEADLSTEEILQIGIILGVYLH